MESSHEHGKIVVLVPYPFQGRLTPLLQLGSILYSKGFSVVVAHSELNSPNPSDHPEFIFVPLSDGLAGYDVSLHNAARVIHAMNAKCEAQFQDYMAHMLEKQNVEGEVACIIHDVVMSFADTVANHLKIPSIVCRTGTAASVHSGFLYFELLEKKIIPLPESQLEDAVPNEHPLRYKDLPFPPSTKLPEATLDLVRGCMTIKSASGIIWNSMDVLEHLTLQKLQQRCKVPFFSIGPFHRTAAPSHTSLLKEDSTCLSWLDKQAPGSVIYVSLGSVAKIEDNALIEMAWGLANSEHPFLWVIRPSLVDGLQWIECLPKDFKEKTQERGCIVKWAPQKKVLSHPGVGGFLTHCGWNSTLESLCEGVPMICRPCFSDQMVNARYLTHVWGVGLELESALDRLCIEKAVRTLMAGNEGKEMKQRAIEMKREIELSLQPGGSSYNSLKDLVKFINTQSEKKSHASHLP